jgi:hypothetical protein
MRRTSDSSMKGLRIQSSQYNDQSSLLYEPEQNLYYPNEQDYSTLERST